MQWIQIDCIPFMLTKRGRKGCFKETCMTRCDLTAVSSPEMHLISIEICFYDIISGIEDTDQMSQVLPVTTIRVTKLQHDFLL